MFQPIELTGVQYTFAAGNARSCHECLCQGGSYGCSFSWKLYLNDISRKYKLQYRIIASLLCIYTPYNIRDICVYAVESL